jgi:hypothetical protein
VAKRARTVTAPKAPKTVKTAPRKQNGGQRLLGKKPKSPARAEGTAGSEEVTIDRRRTARRLEKGSDPARTRADSPPLERRQKVNRRRQIDPTTCERDYTEDEVEFMNALDDYKRASGRMFPTCSEVLEVVRGLGYVKLSPLELTSHQTIAPLDSETTVEGDHLEDTDDDAERCAEFGEIAAS